MTHVHRFIVAETVEDFLITAAHLPSPAGRRAGDEGATMSLEQTIAANVAEILET